MGKTILLIDDKEAIAKVLKVYFLPEYDIVYFNNPIKGIYWLEEGNVPDLILLDLYMPVMQGSDFLFYMKNNELFSPIPIVILSSENNRYEYIRLLEAGAADFMIKPFNPKELKIRIGKILDL